MRAARIWFFPYQARDHHDRAFRCVDGKTLLFIQLAVSS